MPSLTTTIEEYSPLITYRPAWQTDSTDSLANRYSDSSFLTTSTPGASATFAFNGTAVQIFGAKRANHGPYVVQLDNTTFPVADGAAPAPGLFQQALFDASGLPLGLHEVTITNMGTGSTFLDIDFITWTTEIGRPMDKVYVNTVQDDDPAFTYSPSWTPNPKDVGRFLGGSGHTSGNLGATFTYTFQGEGMSLYGPVGPDGAAYSVQLDGTAPLNFTSNKEVPKTQVLLYHANNLPSGMHTLRVTGQPAIAGQSLSVDYANFYTTMQTNEEDGLSTASIVGIALSGVIIFGVFVALFFLLRRRQRQQCCLKDELEYGLSKEMRDKPYGERVTISSFGHNAGSPVPPGILLHGGATARPQISWGSPSGSPAGQRVRFSEPRDYEDLETSESSEDMDYSRVQPTQPTHKPDTSFSSITSDSSYSSSSSNDSTSRLLPPVNNTTSNTSTPPSSYTFPSARPAERLSPRSFPSPLGRPRSMSASSIARAKELPLPMPRRGLPPVPTTVAPTAAAAPSSRLASPFSDAREEKERIRERLGRESRPPDYSQATRRDAPR